MKPNTAQTTERRALPYIPELRFIVPKQFTDKMEQIKWMMENKLKFIRGDWNSFQRQYSFSEIIYYLGEPTYTTKVYGIDAEKSVASIKNVRLFLNVTTFTGHFDGNGRLYNPTGFSCKQISVNAHKVFEKEEPEYIWNEHDHFGLWTYDQHLDRNPHRAPPSLKLVK